MHGANRFGGNGVANSTVFGGIAGDIMGTRTAHIAALPEPDKSAVDVVYERAFAPLGRKPGNLPEMRERLYNIMWNDVGVMRTAESLARGNAALDQLSRDIAACGVADFEPPLQSDLDGPAQSGKPHPGQPRHLRRRRLPPRQPRRAFSRGLSADV